MRAIDGDRLKRKAQEVATEAWKMKIKANVEVILNEFIDWINDAPTIEPERKKGQWIPEFNGMFKGGAYWFKCSECERIVPEVRNGGWNYCPNCGADMTEGKG